MTMRVYAHWLDGEYRKALTGVTVQQPQSPEDERAERIIKTLALFGGTFVLSDVQIVDSPVLWKLFSQETFLKFLRTNLDFLQLVGRPFTTGSDSRWAIVTGGLERAIKAGRIASPMADDGSVISLSQKIVDGGPAVDFDRLLLERRDSPDLQALQGFVASVQYFAAPPSHVAAPSADRPHHTFYGVLKTALHNPELIGIDRQHVEATIKMVDDALKDPALRTRRALVYEHLDMSSPQHISIWRTIVQAWNVAAQKSVCETGGSIGHIPFSPPIGTYVDQPTDFMLREGGEDFQENKRLAKLVPEIPIAWDPGDLSWSDLLRISEDERCADARARLHQVILAGEPQNTTQAVLEFADCVGPMIKGRIQPPVPWWIWALGPVILRFGGSQAPMLGVALFAGQVGERGIVRALNKLRNRVIAIRVVESASRVGLGNPK